MGHGVQQQLVCVLLCALLALAPAVQGQTADGAEGMGGAVCVEAGAGEMERSQCHAVVDYAVYVPDGLSIAELDAAAAAGTGPALLGLVAPACTEQVLRFVCTSAFRPCLEVEVAPGVAVALPKPVCHETCASFLAECAEEAVFQAPGAMPQCEQTSELTMQPEYPEEAVQLSLGEDGPVVAVECSADEAEVTAAYTAIPAGRCEAMQETVYSQCSNLIEHEVFVPHGSTQKELDFNTYNGSFPLLWQVVEEECSAAAFRFTCAAGFLGCDAYELAPGVVLALPRGPCHSVCREFNWHCEEVLTGGEQDNRVPCEAALPPEELIVPVSPDLVLSASCVTPPHNVSLYRECPPLTALDQGDECVLECPSPIYTHTEWTVYMVLVSVAAWISIFSALLIACCFFCHPLKRSYPRSNPAWQVLYLTPYMIAYAIPSLSGGIKNAWCEGSAPSQRGDGPFCVISAWLAYGGAWMGLIWYNFVGLTLLLIILKLDRLPGWIAQLITHGLSLAFTVVWLIVLTSTDSFDNVGAGPCLLDQQLWHDWFPDAVFWIPYTMLLISAVLLLLAVFLYTVFVMGIEGIAAHWRIMAYLLVGLVAVGYASTYHWERRVEEDSLSHNIGAWVACSAMEIHPDRCQPGRLLPFTPFLLNVLITMLVAPAFALILLSDPIFTNYWKYWIQRYILRRDTPYPFSHAANVAKLGSAITAASEKDSTGNSFTMDSLA